MAEISGGGVMAAIEGDLDLAAEAGEDVRAAFAAALRRGSGRAMTLLRKNPDAPDLRDELLRACLSDLTYDPQCEGSRAPYLHRLLGETAAAGCWFDALSPALGGRGEGDGQLFAVLCLLAADDPGLDRARLRGHLAALPFDAAAFGPMEALVGLDGVAAVLLCAATFGDAFLDEDRDWGGTAFRCLVEALRARDGGEAAGAALDHARRGSPPLDALLSRPEPAAPISDAAPPDDASVRAAMVAGRPAPLRWIRAAGDAALQAAAEDLAAAPDDVTRARLLRLFAHRDYPGPATDLIPLSRSPHRRVAHCATLALGRLAHPDVRALALALLDEGSYPERAIRLLRANFEDGDLARVAAVLRGPPLDDDARHALGYALLDLVGDATVTGGDARGLLLWLYEEGPCAICRATAVERLEASGGLPAWMAEEGRFDAERDTVEAAARASGPA